MREIHGQLSKINKKVITLGEKEPDRRLKDADYQELKSRIHNRLLDLLDLSLLNKLEQSLLREEIRKLVTGILGAETVPLNLRERETLIQDIQDEVLGLGPLEPLLQDPTLSDILVNTHSQVYVERSGKLEFTDVRFKDDNHLRNIIDKIVSRLGRRVDEYSPMVDARLPDGSRVNAIIPPLAIDGPILSIRRFAAVPFEVEDLIAFKTITPEIGDLFKGIIRAKLNILISGGTGSGKTTLLNVLSGFAPPYERIITIEDSAELQLKQKHVVRLETRPPNIEGKGEIRQRELVRNSLRMRPDRILIGEVRGDEALDMLQAMNTGHDGSLTTIHANSVRDALTRLETMVSMARLNIPSQALRFYISSALNVVIHLERLSDGTRKVMSMQEITGMEGDIITLQELFRFEQTGVDAQGMVRGRFRMMGLRPRFMEKFKVFGISIPEGIFNSQKEYEI